MTRTVAVLAAACVFVGSAVAAEAPPTKILRCKDAQGRVLITDPSDPRCYTPPLTPDELAKQQEERRIAMEKYRECMAQQRADQTLLSRYPNKAKHDAARQAALDGLTTQRRINEQRIEELQKARKRLLEDAEFYPDGKLPAKLKRDLDTNSASLEARKQAIATLTGEEANINKFYDEQLARLKVLWAPQPGDIRACVQPRIVKEPEPAR